MTLVEFLLARIAEDEETARDANEQRLSWWSQQGRMVINDAGHMQRFTPTRMLAECRAKRAIVAQARAATERLDEALAAARRRVSGDVGTRASAEHLTATLAALVAVAAVWADHPDHAGWDPRAEVKARIDAHLDAELARLHAERAAAREGAPTGQPSPSQGATGVPGP